MRIFKVLSSLMSAVRNNDSKSMCRVLSHWQSINLAVGLLMSILFTPFTSLSQGSGYTLTFDGNSEFVDVGDQVANGCRTIEMWFKPSVDITSSLTSPKSLIIRDFDNASGQNTNEFGLFFSPNNWALSSPGELVFLRRVGTTQIQIVSDSDFWEAEHWYHVCATIDPVSGMKLYINGVLQQDTDASVNQIGTQTGTQWDKISIGRWGSQNIRYFEGEIDEVRLWENTRNESEIRDKMCSSLSGNEQGLRAYWNFDGGTGTTLMDNSVNSYNGVTQAMNNANWIYSGAPIGDVSIHSYPGNLVGASLTLSTIAGDAFTTNNFNSTAEGVQLYKVNALPNVYTGLNSLVTNNYYGVFLTSTNGTYDVSYNYSSYVCSSCDEVFSRNDNAILNWQINAAPPVNCEFNLVNESSTGYDYRAEYIINAGTTVNLGDLLGNDTILCVGDSYTLSLQIPTATYLWQDGSMNPAYTVTQPGLYYATVNQNGCSSTDSVDIQFVEPLVVNLGNDTTLCGSLLLEVDDSGFDMIWSTNETSGTIEVIESGTYFVTVFTPCGSVTESITVSIISQPNAQFLTRSHPTELIDPEVQFVNQSAGANSYEWHFGDGAVSTDENPVHSYDTSGIYLTMLVAYGAPGFGCNDTSYLYVEVDGLCTFYVPNAFTPDSDGLNDFWGPEGLSCNYSSYELEIYDRWGGLIWWTENPNKWWDGNNKKSNMRLKQGLYVYQFRLDRTGAFDSKVINGTVTLYRHN